MASKQPLFAFPLLGLLLAIGGIAAGCQSRPGPDLLLLQRRQEQLELKRALFLLSALCAWPSFFHFLEPYRRQFQFWQLMRVVTL